MSALHRAGPGRAPEPRTDDERQAAPVAGAGSPARRPADGRAVPAAREPLRRPAAADPDGGAAAGVPTARRGPARGVPSPAPPPDIEASGGVPPAESAVRALVALGPDAAGRAAARDRVVAAHLPLVVALARRYTGRGEPLDDLVQVGTIGLITAVDRYDPARGVPLGAFAVPHVLGEIRRHFRDRGWAVRVPRRLQEHGRSVAQARAALSQSLGRSPTVTEVARACDLDTDLVVAALESASAYATVPLEDDGQSGAGSLVAEDAGLSDVEDRLLLRPLLEALPARERRIIALRFVRGMSQAQIAAEVGISQMHVSRLLGRTLAALRDQLSDRDDEQRQVRPPTAVDVPATAHQRSGCRPGRAPGR
ncbi:SigB/SigF/SigG family RNA polymerase sigma factor [Pseudokineococcus basanitobsidens]|uniref:SigB/SigF/SigG family RNA polymerase sigma factor n=1 Tax=Pseudokineococcus basanitobsidens TaxID=1926649 RepID=A0ABU8RM87_9ACTN